MQKAYICLAGISIIVALGYVNVNCYAGKDKVNIFEKLFLGSVLFLQTPFLIHLINILFGGRILSNRANFLIGLSLVTLISLFFASRAIRNDIAARGEACEIPGSERSPIVMIFVFIVLVISTVLAVSPMAIGINLGGDANKHIMYANQLLEGFASSHFPPYEGVPQYIYYPFLVHSTIAFFVNLLNIHIFDAYLIVQIYQSLLLTLSILILVNKMTSNRWIALFAVVLVALYGGHHVVWDGGSWWFNPAIERIMPHHITRMVSLGFVPVFFYSLIRLLEGRHTGFFFALSCVILGLSGLCHTYAFVFLCGVLFFYILQSFGEKACLKYTLGVLIIGTLFASLAYLPSFIQQLTGPGEESALCGVAFARGQAGQVFITPSRFFNDYGIVGVLGVLGIVFQQRKKDKFLRALAMTIVFVLVVTYAKEIWALVSGGHVPYHPVQQKFGKSLYIAFAILSCFALTELSVILKRKKTIAIRLTHAFIALSITLIILIGFRSVVNFTVTWSIRGAMGIVNNAFRKENNIVNVARRIGSKKDVFAVPEEIKLFANMTGLRVLYADHPKAYSHCRKLANAIIYIHEDKIAPIEKRNGMPYRRIVADVLGHFDVTHIVAPERLRYRFDELGFLHPLGEGPWKGKRRYSIYRVDMGNIPKTKDREISSNMDRFLHSSESYRDVLSFIPLCNKRTLRPKLLASGELEISGATWGDQVFWISDGRKKRLYSLDPKNGRILSSFPASSLSIGGLAWDGQRLWCSDKDKGEIHALDPKTAEISRTIPTPVQEPAGLAWAEGALWSLDRATGAVYHIRPTDGRVEDRFVIPGRPLDIHWHHGHLWGIFEDGRVCRLSPEEGERVTCYASPSDQPVRIIWVGAHLWCADERSKEIIQYAPCLSRDVEKNG